MGTPDWKTARIEKATANCSHHCLKEVEISGYRGYECYDEHVMYLKMNVVALGKIIINPVRFWCWPTGIERNGIPVKEEAFARDHAIQYLKQKMPSTIEYVCLQVLNNISRVFISINNYTLIYLCLLDGLCKQAQIEYAYFMFFPFDELIMVFCFD